MKRAYLVAALSVIVAACTAGTDYGGPPSTGSATVARGSFRSATMAAPLGTVSARWWEPLGDPQLSKLIDRALTNAPDMEIAMARLEQAQAQVDHVRSVVGPHLAANAGGTVLAASGAPAPTLLPERHTFAAYDAGLQAGWEIDLFGRGRRQREAAGARRDAAVASLADTQVMLSAAVAQHYLDVRAAEKAVLLERRKVERLSEIDRLTVLRVRGGSASAETATQSAAELDKAKSLIHNYRL